MARRKVRTEPAPMPRSARWLGFAGLIPQVALAAVVIGGPPDLGPTAVRLALCYAALILSFLGGTWWGLAAQSGKRSPPWMWVAAVAPSLVAFAALGLWVLAQSPAASIAATGAALIAALAVDYKLAASGLCPSGWLGLRTPLSLGLGGLCLLIATIAA